MKKLVLFTIFTCFLFIALGSTKHEIKVPPEPTIAIPTIAVTVEPTKRSCDINDKVREYENSKIKEEEILRWAKDNCTKDIYASLIWGIQVDSESLNRFK